MREVVFLKRNEKKWRRVENIIASNEQVSPDVLGELFIELNDDLAYSRTNYPDSNTTKYLNGITSSIYNSLYTNKKERKNRFISFWTEELPLAVYEARRQFLYAFLFFFACCVIGAFSTAYDESFPRIVLGDRYVELTLENIDNGDPMAIYKDSDSSLMFFQITLNNIKVSFWTFISGIFFSFGTYWFLFRNGIMLGTFQWFFYTKGLLWTSFLSIWIHGTIEISCIIIAGTAGIILGNSFMYPDTEKRLVSLRRGARRATKIFLGIVPFIVAAGFLESFVTRLTEHHWSIRLAIILGSLSFIVLYFIVYPRKVAKSINSEN